MKTTLCLLLLLFAEANSKFNTKRLTKCMELIDLPTAAKVANCKDIQCARAAKQYARKSFPQEFAEIIQPCIQGTDEPSNYLTQTELNITTI